MSFFHGFRFRVVKEFPAEFMFCGILFSAPGMGDDYRVKDPNTLGSRKC